MESHADVTAFFGAGIVCSMSPSLEKRTLDQRAVGPNREMRIAAARGEIPCDLVVRNVRYLDVFSCQFRTGDVAVMNGFIVGTDSGLTARREIDGKGRFLVPGFIDAHVHLESSLMAPHHFDRAVLNRGTTTAICDPHELTNVIGVGGIGYFLDAATEANLDLRVMLSSCVPATSMETNGAGVLAVEALLPFKNHPKALGLAEMMNFPGVLNRDPSVMAKIEAFSDRIIDGHCPRLRGRDLSAYIGAGISSCHESSELSEAQEKHSKGMSVWIREGSVAKDLHTLLPMLNAASSPGIGFCTDDRNPLDIAEEGHVDHLVRTAIKCGVLPEVVFRSASWSVARHYGLNKGAIAPGYEADFVILNDLNSVGIESVFRRGIPAVELEYAKIQSTQFGGSVRAKVPEAADLVGARGNVNVIDVVAGSIVTGRSVGLSTDAGVYRLTVLERYGHGSRPANAYVRGFGSAMRGAIASSVGHDSHNLIVVGSNPQDMRQALAALINCGGGFVVVRDLAVMACLELPIAGLMTPQDPAWIVDKLKGLRSASKAIGCELHEPFLQLAFLSLPVIPSLKLTDRGLVDVDRFEIIPVAV